MRGQRSNLKGPGSWLQNGISFIMAVHMFPDEKTALRWLAAIRWSAGPVFPIATPAAYRPLVPAPACRTPVASASRRATTRSWPTQIDAITVMATGRLSGRPFIHAAGSLKPPSRPGSGLRGRNPRGPDSAPRQSSLRCAEICWRTVTASGPGYRDSAFGADFNHSRHTRGRRPYRSLVDPPMMTAAAATMSFAKSSA